MQEMSDDERWTNIAALNQKVIGLESDVQTLGQRLDSGLTALRQDFVASFERINHKLDSRDDRKWMLAPAIGFLMFILTMVGGLGTMALLPIRSEQETLRGYIREAKEDRIRAISELHERDKFMLEQLRQTRSQLDYMRGQLAPLPR
jgi:hypothetical protein